LASITKVEALGKLLIGTKDNMDTTRLAIGITPDVIRNLGQEDAGTKSARRTAA